MIYLVLVHLDAHEFLRALLSRYEKNSSNCSNGGIDSDCECDVRWWWVCRCAHEENEIIMLTTITTFVDCGA